ncbi:Retrovirus-related Pol polyprotein from transposon TNT 1-94 [Araneus ventricosus]|uniref:Retrovirus-related Pol polyprotein from transposon TNT 1-94 n=1 Tax=Araneus ventricosus TaxID=182803 RepID=A0A4Y2MNU9_ARAVE|nr:Retrovirus-related Pol polyprotein from transposon TNT 1-94 [Araneus ventricosus]
MDRISVPELTGTNYFIWSLKMQAALSLKRLDSVTTQMKPEGLSEKDALEWKQKNSDAVAYIKLSLSDEQALQFAAENNAKILWDKIKSTFTGQTEDRKIDAGNELKNLQINSNELANDYIARARGIATKCHSLGLDVSPRELVYYTVRGLKGKFAKVRDILKTQRDKSIDEVLEILREEETSFNSRSSTRAEGRSADVFYSRKSKNSGMRLCYVCRRPNHVAKDCFYRIQKESTTTSQRRKVHRNNNSKERNTANPVFTAAPNEESLCENIWILDSGASCHMAKDSVWFEKILPERKDIYLAEFVNEQLDTYLANSGIFHEKTISYNSESNGKAERANRILLERARSLLYESELPLKFWAEAINFSTQVSNVTPRKGKEKIPLETWIGKKPKLNYLKKFGCVAYFHVPKVMRNKYDVPGRRGIMLGYARDRKDYRIYDIKNRKIIEERSIKFNQSLKGSTYLGKTKVETWNIDSLFESTQDINEFDHKTKVNHLEISAKPAANENNYSIPFETPDDATNTVGGEIETPVDQIPVRRSERLKAKQMSTNLACNVPNSYLEAKNSADWQNWEFAMKNELDSLNKHKVWEIVDRPAKTKLVKSKWVYSLKQSDNGETKYKARLVAAGSNQIKNKDYLESYSPVVNIESFRLLITLASKLNLMVRFFDVKTAYLYSDIEETVYMLPPPGFERLVGDEKVCKLKRSIYGLPQSGKNWYMKIKSELEKFGLTQLASDNCVFIKSDGQNMLLLCMHVDDLAIFCNNDEMYQDIVNSIKSVFEVHEKKHLSF